MPSDAAFQELLIQPELSSLDALAIDGIVAYSVQSMPTSASSFCVPASAPWIWLTAVA